MMHEPVAALRSLATVAALCAIGAGLDLSAALGRLFRTRSTAP